MNYRFQKFTTVYPVFVEKFLADNPGYEQLSYQDLYDKFVGTLCGWGDFFAKHMESLGNESQHLFASFESLQKAWARENHVTYKEDSWLKDIMLAQVKVFQPEVLFLQDLYLFDQNFRGKLREICQKKVLIVGWRSAPTEDFAAFNDLDIIATAGPHFVTEWRRHGANAILLPLAFERAILDIVKPVAQRDLDFTFIGSLFILKGFHSQRYAIIEQLMQSTPLQIWGEVSKPQSLSRKGQALNKAIYRANKFLEKAGASEDLRAKLPLVRRGVAWMLDPALPSIKDAYPNRFHEPVFGAGNYELLARSKIVFNSHIDCAENYAGNVRLFEATGMGSCLLTDWKVNLPDFFEPDMEVVTYRSAEEAVEKVRYLLEHEDERRAIAAAGQRRTLREHTLEQHVVQLDKVIRKTLCN